MAEPRRGGGIGTALVRAAEQWARSRDLMRVRVRSNVVRERTHAFYETLGCTTSKRQKEFDQKLD